MKRSNYKKSEIFSTNHYIDGDHCYYCKLCKLTFKSASIFGGHYSHCRKKFNNKSNLSINVMESNFPCTDNEVQNIVSRYFVFQYLII